MEPSFIHKQDDFLRRIAKNNTEIRLLAKDGSMEVMKQRISKGTTFYLDSADDWQGFEFIYLLEGKLTYTGIDPPVALKPGDYISRRDVPEKSWFRTETDVTVLYTSSQPAFYLMREEIQDFLDLAREIESAEQMDGHSKRLQRMSEEVGKKMGLTGEELSRLGYASFFHDLGKAKLSDRILEKPGKLSAEEWEEMEKHPTWGREMLEEREFLAPVAEIVEQTHERIDGRGYPEGLEGEEISIEAKIVSVADAYDAMTNDRPYRKGLSEKEAVKELRVNAGTQFDRRVVDVFLETLQEWESSRIEPTAQKDKFKQEVARLKQRKYFLELGQKILSQNQVSEILSEIARVITGSTMFRRAVISLYDRSIDPADNPEEVSISDFASSGIGKEEKSRLQKLKQKKIPVNLDKFDSKFLVGKSYYIPHHLQPDSLDDQSLIRGEAEEKEPAGWHPDDILIVPLYRGRQIIGHISADEPRDGLPPSEERLRPIEAFASLAALAVEKARRIEELDEQRKSVEEQKEKLEALHKFVEKLRTQKKEGDVCKIVGAWAHSILNFNWCIIFLRHEDKLVPTCSFPPDFIERVRESEFNRRLACFTVQNGETVWGNVEDIPQSGLENLGFESIISLPVEDTGNIQIVAKEKNAFAKQDVMLAELLAGHMYQEIRRIRLEKNVEVQQS